MQGLTFAACRWMRAGGDLPLPIGARHQLPLPTHIRNLRCQLLWEEKTNRNKQAATFSGSFAFI